MAFVLPTRLLRYDASNGDFYVFHPYAPDAPKVHSFDIISYTWGDPVPEYDCGIRNVTWVMTISETKLRDIKRLMIKDSIEFLWADCVCINQANEDEKLPEVARMYEYYKSARKCHILLEIEDVWDPQEIVDNLKFVDHILSSMGGRALASEAKLTEQMTKDLSEWANKKPWTFHHMDKSAVRSAAIDLGVLNCYWTCTSRVRLLFRNLYFSRVWTFQEMLLGKNITLWGINPLKISCIGELDVWMDLATDSKDKAYKLQDWIDSCRVLNTASVNTILSIIQDDKDTLNDLQMLVAGISSARTDIINGGPSWWYRNHKGVSNIFSAVSIMPRKCKERADIFKGLLGVFSGLFTAEELKRDMDTNDINAISFAFFKQLSIKTGYAWTKLAISSGERGEWDWIPVIPSYDKVLTTDCFSGVVNLGVLRNNSLVRAMATTGINGVPRQYIKILLTSVENRGFQFYFKGCNCGKKVKTGKLSSEPIPTYDQCRDVVGDETGGILVQCATILGSVMDPGNNVIKYRENLLDKLQPYWDYTDPNAKPRDWIERCVSGTDWENPHPLYFRRHNMSMNYRMIHMRGCGSRLENASTESISCEVLVNCGCKIIAPFSLVFEAITAVKGSPLGEQSATLDKARRIILRDGLGLVQVGDLGRAFNLVAFGGDIDAHKSHASLCRKTRIDKPLPKSSPNLSWPVGRALVREEFSHGATDMMRDYGYVETRGRGSYHDVETGDPETHHDVETGDPEVNDNVENKSCGNLLICRNHPMGHYKIIGVCIDGKIANKKGRHTVSIQ